MAEAWLCQALQEEAVRLKMKEQTNSCSGQGWGWEVASEMGR